jgi:hypothetical protein
LLHNLRKLCRLLLKERKKERKNFTGREREGGFRQTLWSKKDSWRKGVKTGGKLERNKECHLQNLTFPFLVTFSFSLFYIYMSKFLSFFYHNFALGRHHRMHTYWYFSKNSTIQLNKSMCLKSIIITFGLVVNVLERIV